MLQRWPKKKKLATEEVDSVKESFKLRGSILKVLWRKVGQDQVWEISHVKNVYHHTSSNRTLRFDRLLRLFQPSSWTSIPCSGSAHKLQTLCLRTFVEYSSKKVDLIGRFVFGTPQLFIFTSWFSHHIHKSVFSISWHPTGENYASDILWLAWLDVLVNLLTSHVTQFQHQVPF